MAIMVCAAILWWISGEREIEPPSWVPDYAYQVSFVLTLASGLQEPGFAMVDQLRQAQRLTYYSGGSFFATLFLPNNKDINSIQQNK